MNGKFLLVSGGLPDAYEIQYGLDFKDTKFWPSKDQTVEC